MKPRGVVLENLRQQSNIDDDDDDKTIYRLSCSRLASADQVEKKTRQSA